MAIYRDGLKVPTEIWEAAMMHKHLKVTCSLHSCEHSAVFQPHALHYLFARRGWNQSFRHAERRFWCRPCTRLVGFKVKKAVMTMTNDEVTNTTLPLPSEREWKHFIARHRG